MSDYYTWSQFVAEVKKLIPLEAQRKGVGSSADDFLLSYIRQAVIQLQNIVDAFRIGHETIYEISDLVQEGLALKGIKPPQSAIRNIVFFQRFNDHFDRYESESYPWSKRSDLTGGHVPVNDNIAKVAIDPQGYSFYIYPTPKEGEEWAVSMTWDGKKLDFKDDELVPFTEQMALAVAYFAAANVALYSDEDSAKFDRYITMYEREKPRLFISAKENSEMKGSQ